MQKIFIIFLCGLISGVISKLPKDVVKCKVGDNICVTDQINYIIKNHSHGIESLHLVDLNPIKYKFVQLTQGADSSVNIDLKSYDNLVYGVNLIKFIKTSGFGKNLSEPHTIYFYCPNITTVSNYKIEGKILILPIHGSGVMKLSALKMDCIQKMQGVPMVKDGKTYLNITKISVRSRLKKLVLNFENLFNDKALSDNMNKFLNDNWEDIWLDMQSTVENAINEIFESVLRSVFENTPYNELLSDE